MSVRSEDVVNVKSMNEGVVSVAATRASTPSQIEQFVDGFLQIQSIRQWLSDYPRKKQNLQIAGLPTEVLEAEYKSYRASKTDSFKKVFTNWHNHRFPQWAALGQKLYIELLVDDNEPELLIKTANSLAIHYLQLAKRLHDVSFQAEPHHEYCLNSIPQFFILAESKKVWPTIQEMSRTTETALVFA